MIAVVIRGLGLGDCLVLSVRSWVFILRIMGKLLKNRNKVIRKFLFCEVSMRGW